MKHVSLIAYLFLCTAQISQAMERTLHKTKKPSRATLVCQEGIDHNEFYKVQLGLLQGADVNHKDEYGQSFLYLACLYKNKPIIKELLSQNNINVSPYSPKHNLNPLHMACQNNLRKTTQKILSRKRNTAMEPDDNGDIPLHKASYFLNKNCIEILLIAFPWSVNYQNYEEKTPMHIVCENHNNNPPQKTLKIIKLFIANGADTTIIDNLHATPFSYLSDWLKSMIWLLL